MDAVRRLLEGEAARAAIHGPAAASQALREEQAAFRESGEFDALGISETGQALHELIVAHCGNDVLRGVILSLRGHFTRFRSLSIQIPHKVLSLHHGHIVILDSLSKGTRTRPPAK